MLMALQEKKKKREKKKKKKKEKRFLVMVYSHVIERSVVSKEERSSSFKTGTERPNHSDQTRAQLNSFQLLTRFLSFLPDTLLQLGHFSVHLGVV